MTRISAFLCLLAGLLGASFSARPAHAQRPRLALPNAPAVNTVEPAEPGGEGSEEFDMPEAIGFHYDQRKSEDGTVPPNALIIAYQDKLGMSLPRSAGLSNLSWSAIGPNNIGGRVRSILIHPTLINTMWIGSVGGGIWKTTDGGASWNFINDFLPGLAIGCMALDPADPNVLYAGTGEGFFNQDSLPGVGILKSIDGGTTWAQITSTIPTNPDPTADAWGYVNRISISPTDSQTILAATNGGIFRTTNGGTSWTQTRFSRTLDVDFHPTDGLKAVAGGDTGVPYYSTDGGVSWTAATSTGGARVEVAYARSSPTTVYASVQLGSGRLYQSVDGGVTYTLKNSAAAYLASQGWYDNALWVDPTNPARVIVGGVDLYRSTNSGTTLTKISAWQSGPPIGSTSAHADQHIIVNHPGYDGVTNNTVFFGNDGGFFKAANVLTVAQTSGWTNLNNGLAITQFYGGAVSAGGGAVIGGTQDNGTLRTAGSIAWTAMFGGDGGFCAADPVDPAYLYGEYVYCRIHRSVNNGLNSSYIYNLGANQLTDAVNSAANFISFFAADPNNHDRLLAGCANLWRSNNVRATNPAWFIIKASVGSNVSAIAVAKGNSDIVWVGHNNGAVYKTTNGTAASPTWTKVYDNPTALPNRYCTSIAIDPANTNRVYVSFSGYTADNAWKTSDAGATWTKITGPGLPGQPNTLPRAPVNSIVLHPAIPGWLYVGTDIGVFGSTDSGANWASSNDGPANVDVEQLMWRNPTKLIAATHGRSMFEATLDLSTLDCNNNSVLDAAEIAGNPSLDCNSNGILDSCELAADPTRDCNHNSVLDDCELAGGDCDGNAILDSCELAANPALDCNNDSILDRCQPGGGDCDGNSVTDFCELAGRDCDTNGLLDTCELSGPVTAQDLCVNALRVEPGTVYAGTNAGSTNDGTDNCNAAGALPPDVWYKYSPSSSGSAILSLCGSSFDTVLSVHGGCPGTTANQLACDDDICNAGGASQLTVSVTAGQTYLIRITGYANPPSPGDTGNFVLKITGPAAYAENDCNGNGVLDACEPASTGPLVTVPPVGASACVSGTAAFSVTAIGQATLTYQWRKGTTDLGDGGNISGAGTPTLTISPAGLGDAASNYNCKVSNACKTVVSNNAALAVFPGGSGDGNLDSLVNGADIGSFISALLSGGPASAAYCAFDMDGNGVVNELDISPFVAWVLSF